MLKLARRICYSAAAGILAGLAATLFLYALSWATTYRLSNIQVIYLLPLAGLLIGATYAKYGTGVEAHLVLEEIHNPSRPLPGRLTPMIFLSTIATHFFGGSAGREGTAVQMGAALADQVSRHFRLPPLERRALLIAGSGAGFGAAVGAPIAGVIFGMEAIRIGRFRLEAWLESIIASLFSYIVTVFLMAPHSHYPDAPPYEYNLNMVLGIIVLAVTVGLMVRLFIFAAHGIEKLQSRIPVAGRPVLAGVLLIALYRIFDPTIYSGLGIETIQFALKNHVSFALPLVKGWLTALTIGSGFKGGEFVPLVFMGTTLGSALSNLFYLPAGALGAIGFSAAFGAASNTPIACSIMAAEIFGLPSFLPSLGAGFLAYLISGPVSIYPSQRPGKKLWYFSLFPRCEKTRN